MDIQRLSENRVKCTFTKDELLYDYGIDLTKSPEESKKSFQENINHLAMDILEELEVEMAGDMKVTARIMPGKDDKVDLYLSYASEDMPLPPVSPLDILGQIFGKFMQKSEECERVNKDTISSAAKLAKVFSGEDKNEFIDESVVYKFNDFQAVVKFVNIIGKQKVDSSLFKNNGKYFLKLSKFTKGMDVVATEFLAGIDEVDDSYLSEHAETIIKEKALESILAMN